MDGTEQTLVFNKDLDNTVIRTTETDNDRSAFHSNTESGSNPFNHGVFTNQSNIEDTNTTQSFTSTNGGINGVTHYNNRDTHENDVFHVNSQWDMLI
jgi:hypothetical protein